MIITATDYKNLNLPEPEKRILKQQKVSLNALFASIVEAMGDKSLIQFGGAAPAPELLPYKTINRSIRSVIIADIAVTNIHNPLGYVTPEDRKRRLVKMMI